MDFLPPFVILLAAFVDGEALVQIITDPRAVDADADRSAVARLRLGPQQSGPQWWAGEVVQLARSNHRTIPRPRRSFWSTAC
jgi:hypothetical protein